MNPGRSASDANPRLNYGDCAEFCPKFRKRLPRKLQIPAPARIIFCISPPASGDNWNLRTALPCHFPGRYSIYTSTRAYRDGSDGTEWTNPAASYKDKAAERLLCDSR